MSDANGDELLHDITHMDDATYSAKYGMCGGCGDDNEKCCGGCKESLCRRCPERMATGEVPAMDGQNRTENGTVLPSAPRGGAA